MQPNHESAVKSISRSQEQDATFQLKVNPHNHVVKVTRKPLKHQSQTHRYIKQSANVPLDGYWVKQCKEVFSLLTGWVTCCSQTSDDQHQEHSSTYTSSVCTWSPSNLNHVQLFVSLSTGKASVASATPSSSEPTSFLFVLTSEKATTNQSYCLWSKNKVLIFVKYSATNFD